MSISYFILCELQCLLYLISITFCKTIIRFHGLKKWERIICHRWKGEMLTKKNVLLVLRVQIVYGLWKGNISYAFAITRIEGCCVVVKSRGMRIFKCKYSWLKGSFSLCYVYFRSMMYIIHEAFESIDLPKALISIIMMNIEIPLYKRWSRSFIFPAH